MKKIDIDRFFELLDDEDFEGIFDLLEDSEFKERAKLYDDLEDFFYNEEDNFEREIYRQVPQELLDYYCEKAIDTNNSYLIVDDKTKDDAIKKYEDKVEKIIQSDEATRLEFVKNADEYNKYAIQVAQTLSDDNKLTVINNSKSVNFKYEVAKKITDSTKKLKAIDEIDENQAYMRVDIVITIEDENVRFKAIDLLKDDMHKAEIAKSIKMDQKLKLRAMDKIEDTNFRKEVALTLEDSKDKLEAMDKIEDTNYRKEVALTLEDPKVKLEALDKIEDTDNRKEVALTLEDPKDKLEALDKFNDTYSKKQIAISIDDVNYKLESLGKFKDSKDKQEIIQSFSDEEIMELSEREFTEEQKDIAELIYDSKKKIILKNELQNILKEHEEKGESFKIGLADDMTIGVELESEGESSNIFLGKEIAPGWKGTYDDSLISGVEVNSPILHDSEDDMKMLEAVCNTMKNFGLGTSKRCGGHIHFGADYFEGNPKAFQNLSNIWYQCEELFYKMSNKKGSVPREGIIKYAKTMHRELEPFAGKNTISINSLSDFENMREKLLEKEHKYRGLNLGHYGEVGKNTIEFRISNGTINPKTVKENIKLFGSLMQISKEMALNPEFKKEEYETLIYKGLSEGEKVDALLNLLFDDEKSKDIYRERWESVRDEKIFDELTEGQTQTFKRGDYSISSKQEIRDVANSEEAIEQISAVSEEIKREVKERQQQNQIANNISIDDSTDAR